MEAGEGVREMTEDAQAHILENIEKVASNQAQFQNWHLC